MSSLQQAYQMKHFINKRQINKTTQVHTFQLLHTCQCYIDFVNFLLLVIECSRSGSLRCSHICHDTQIKHTSQVHSDTNTKTFHTRHEITCGLLDKTNESVMRTNYYLRQQLKWTKCIDFCFRNER